MGEICYKVVRLEDDEYRSFGQSPVEVKYHLGKRTKAKWGPLFCYASTHNGGWTARDMVACMAEIGHSQYRVLECEYDAWDGYFDGMINPLGRLTRANVMLFWSDNEEARAGIRKDLGEMFYRCQQLSKVFLYCSWVKPLREIPLEELPSDYDNGG